MSLRLQCLDCSCIIWKEAQHRWLFSEFWPTVDSYDRLHLLQNISRVRAIACRFGVPLEILWPNATQREVSQAWKECFCKIIYNCTGSIMRSGGCREWERHGKRNTSVEWQYTNRKFTYEILKKIKNHWIIKIMFRKKSSSGSASLNFRQYYRSIVIEKALCWKI